jgi:long-chain acyl-CoA synthetase
VRANLAGIVGKPRAVDGTTALIYDGESISYAGLATRVRAAAAALGRYGVGPGDRVAIVLPNTPDFVAAYFGALWAGAVVVPLNLLLRAGEIGERLAAVSARVVVTDAERSALVAEAAARHGIVVVSVEELDGAESGPPADRARSDPAVILFTSGTSGVSKGAVLTHGSIAAAASNAAAALGLGPADVMLGAAPFSHVLGSSTGLVATLATRGALAVVPRFEPSETLATMAETGVTVMLGVPTMCTAMCEAVRAGGRRPPLRLAHIGGAPLPVEVTSEFEGMFGAEVFEGYGLTEISGIATTYRPGQPRKPGSVGHPLGDTELRIVSLDGSDAPPGEIGEIRFRGSSVIPGYWGGEGSGLLPLSDDGWLATGDLGFRDGEGYLFLVDRLKDMIIRNGYNVYPREVEEVLYAHRDVLEAIVVGVPDARIGEEVVALVRPRPGSRCDPIAVHDWVRERVAAYKYPRHVVLVDELPTGPTGKIVKREIDREALARELGLA